MSKCRSSARGLERAVKRTECVRGVSHTEDERGEWPTRLFRPLPQWVNERESAGVRRATAMYAGAPDIVCRSDTICTQSVVDLNLSMCMSPFRRGTLAPGLVCAGLDRDFTSGPRPRHRRGPRIICVYILYIRQLICRLVAWCARVHPYVSQRHVAVPALSHKRAHARAQALGQVRKAYSSIHFIALSIGPNSRTEQNRSLSSIGYPTWR